MSSLSNLVFEIKNYENKKIIYRIFNNDFNLIIDRKYEN